MLVICRICPKLFNLDSILVNVLDDEIGLRNQETNLELVNALLDNLESRFFRTLTGKVLSIHDRKTKVGRISLGSVRNLLQGSHVIQPVKSTLGLFIVTTQENIDLVGTLAQGSREFAAAKVGLRMRREFSAIVGEFVQLEVLVDVSETNRERVRV